MLVGDKQSFIIFRMTVRRSVLKYVYCFLELKSSEVVECQY